MVLSLKRFEGKVAVVTGASSGIGWSIVQHLVKNGLIVAGLARRAEKVEEIAKKLAGEKGQLHAFKCDLTKEEEIISAIKEIISKLGPVHVLVNNAGLSLYGSLINGDTKNWKTILDTNVLALSIATREVIQNMKETKVEGHIVHINSVLGHIVLEYPGVDMYTASKFAVTALAEILRQEINREKLPIKITSLSPGYVKTEFQATAGFGNEGLPIPGLIGDDIAEALVYVLSTPPNVNVTELTVRAVGS